ncbi:hypothetical protein [Xanthomonas euroxanthea]|uniref:hypothetical protein n=1 Tax=Xanthomonas euroxanthea TaxID=2259622 RepID=UPI00160C6C23|nr:hypothetical protein [Xanthomonas euroxanthea]MBB5769108.1 hypothetical protein [Xanthomonas euroxanthea]
MSSHKHKRLHLAIKSAGDASADQLTSIRQYTLADMPADKLYVRTFAIAHNAIDRDRECFDEALLADFARTLPGKGLFIKHPSGWDGDSGPGKGRWFAAKLERMSLDEARTLLREPELKFPPGVETAVLLMADAYLVRTAGNADLLEEIDAGVVGDVSIGCTVKDYERLVDEQGNELNAWRLVGPGEALEASLVWLGAQPGARAVKGAQRTEEDDVDLQKELNTAKDRILVLEAENATSKASHDIVLSLRKALGDHAHLIDKPELLGAAVKSADAYRKSLIDDVVAGERQLGLLGDDEEAVNFAKGMYAGDSIERLESLHKRYAERVGKGGRMPAPTTGGRGGAPDPASGDINPAFA